MHQVFDGCFLRIFATPCIFLNVAFWNDLSKFVNVTFIYKCWIVYFLKKAFIYVVCVCVLVYMYIILWCALAKI